MAGGGGTLETETKSGDATEDWIPATIEDAPNSMKLPTITPAPWRTLARPASIMKPTAETAMIATVVAMVPRKANWSQETAATRTLEPGGSASEPWTAASAERTECGVIGSSLQTVHASWRLG